MLTKHSYIFTSIIIIALCLVKNPRNVHTQTLYNMHSARKLSVRKEIAKGPKRDEEIMNIELRTQLDDVYKLN